MAGVHAALADSPSWAVSPLQSAGACSWFWCQPRHSSQATDKSSNSDSSEASDGGMALLVCCQQGTVVAADPHRLQVPAAAPQTVTSRDGRPDYRQSDGGVSTSNRGADGERSGVTGHPGSRTEAGAMAGGGTGGGGAWARSLWAVQRQAEGMPSSAVAVVLPAHAWRRPAAAKAGGQRQPPADGSVSSAGAVTPTNASAPLAGSPSDPELAAAIARQLQGLQREVGLNNAEAWGGQDSYEAWCTRFGPPDQAAARIVADPATRLGPLLPHLHHLAAAFQAPPSASDSSVGSRAGQSSGGSSRRGQHAAATAVSSSTSHDRVPGGGSEGGELRVANLMGSHGSKAVAMALCPGLGIRPTVVDISEGNARYARCGLRRTNKGQAHGVMIAYRA